MSLFIFLPQINHIHVVTLSLDQLINKTNHMHLLSNQHQTPSPFSTRPPSCLLYLPIIMNPIISEKCDFKTDTCGWNIVQDGVYFNRPILSCGLLGRIERCIFKRYFQDGGIWNRTQIQAIEFDGK